MAGIIPFLQTSYAAMNFLDKYKTISFGDNGYPADNFLRRVIFFVWKDTQIYQDNTRTYWESYCSNQLWRSLTNEQRDEIEHSKIKALGKKLVHGLIEAKTLVPAETTGRYRFKGDKLPPDTVEARSANFSASLLKIAKKTLTSTEARHEMLKFLTNARNLYGFHFVNTSEGKAVVFPASFTLDRQGFRISGATGFISTKRGLEVWDICGDEAFKISFVDSRPKFEISLENSKINLTRTNEFQETMLLPHRPEFSLLLNKVSQEMMTSVRCLSGKRELLSEIFGEDIEPSKWLGFVQSFYRVRPFYTLMRSAIFSILDPEVRKAAGRARKATYAHYNWFFKGSDDIKNRKIQASDTFPLFTGEMTSEPLNKAVISGAPLLPIIAEKFGLTVPQARQMRGVHWQRLGQVIYCYEDLFKKDKRIFLGIPPEKMPKNKADWTQVKKIVDLHSGSTVSCLSDEMLMKLNRNAAHDWAKMSDQEQLDIDIMMSDIARSLAPLTNGTYSPRHKVSSRDMAVFFGIILGGNFGFKRLKSLSADWHRLAPIRTGAIRLMLRKKHNIPLATWEPLTENFTCEHGTLTWLTNEAELISEGLRKRHCVGSYIDRCAEGVTHIATVLSKSGYGSTVEVRLRGGKEGTPFAIQHRAYLNFDPDLECQLVTKSYFKKYAKKKLLAVGGTNSVEPPDITVPLDEEMRSALKEAYMDCVPERVFDMSFQEWEEAYQLYTRDKPENLIPHAQINAYEVF